MRNTAEYYVTKKEVLDFLEREMQERINYVHENLVMGDMGPNIYNYLIDYLESQESDPPLEYEFHPSLELWLRKAQDEEYGQTVVS